jgi:hypothetical protein
MPNHIADTPTTNRQPPYIWNWLKPWSEHGRDSRRFCKTLMNRKTLRQRIDEDTGCDLSPQAIARDRKLRALYEEWVKVKGTSEKTAAYAAFVKFVREEYP